MTENTKQHRLIRHLYELAERDDRASLAALRDGLRPDRSWAALRIVVPRVQSRFAEDDALLIGALFGLYPEKGSTSLASALRRVLDRTQSESIERRFEAMLGASKADLPDHLRHAVALIRGSAPPIGLDWGRLYADLRRWTPMTRRRWAREFWTSSRTETDDSSPDQTPSN